MGHATVEGCCRSTVVANRPALLWGARTRRTTLPAWLPTMNQIPLAPGSAKQHWMQLSNVEHKVERKKTTLPPKARIGAMLKCFVATSSEPASCSSQMARRTKFVLFGPQRRPRNTHPYTAHSIDTTTGIHRGKQSRCPPCHTIEPQWEKRKGAHRYPLQKIL